MELMDKEEVVMMKKEVVIKKFEGMDGTNG